MKEFFLYFFFRLTLFVALAFIALLLFWILSLLTISLPNSEWFFYLTAVSFWLFIIFLIKKIYFSPTKTVVNTAYLIPLFWLVAPIAIFWIIVQYTKYGGESLGYMAMGLFILLPIYLSLIFGTVAVRYFFRKISSKSDHTKSLILPFTFTVIILSIIFSSQSSGLINDWIGGGDFSVPILITYPWLIGSLFTVFFINISYKVFKIEQPPLWHATMMPLIVLTSFFLLLFPIITKVFLNIYDNS